MGTLKPWKSDPFKVLRDVSNTVLQRMMDWANGCFNLPSAFLLVVHIEHKLEWWSVVLCANELKQLSCFGAIIRAERVTEYTTPF